MYSVYLNNIWMDDWIICFEIFSRWCLFRNVFAFHIELSCYRWSSGNCWIWLPLTTNCNQSPNNRNGKDNTSLKIWHGKHSVRKQWCISCACPSWHHLHESFIELSQSFPATQNLNFYWKYRTVPNLHITHQRISPSNNNGNTCPTKRTRWCHNIVASCLYSSKNALQIFKSTFIYRCWWGSNTLECNCHIDDQLT